MHTVCHVGILFGNFFINFYIKFLGGIGHGFIQPGEPFFALFGVEKAVAEIHRHSVIFCIIANMVGFHITVHTGTVIGQRAFGGRFLHNVRGGGAGVAVAVGGGIRLVAVHAVNRHQRAIGGKVSYNNFPIHAGIKIKGDFRVIQIHIQPFARHADIFVRGKDYLDRAVLDRRIIRQRLQGRHHRGHAGFIVGRQHGGSVGNYNRFAF